MAISVVSFSFSRAGQPEAWGPSSLLDAVFYYRILSPNSPISKLTDFLCSPSYIIVQSPTQYLPITGHRNMSLPLSLEWHVWLSSSGNNCLAVHRCISLWLYRGILTLSHIVSQTRPRQWNMHFRRLWNGMFGGVEGQYTTPQASQFSYMLCINPYLHQAEKSREVAWLQEYITKKKLHLKLYNY